MTRADRRTLVRQLADEGLSQRAIAKRLKVSKDTVRRDLEAIEREDEPENAPQDAPDEMDAPQVSGDNAPKSAPQDAPPAAPVDADEPYDAATGAPVAQLPRRVAQDELVVDLRGWPALRRDLALLEQTGKSRQALINQAVVVLAFGYRRALGAGRLKPGQPFLVSDMTVSPMLPAPLGPRRSQDAVTAQGG